MGRLNRFILYGITGVITAPTIWIMQSTNDTIHYEPKTLTFVASNAAVQESSAVCSLPANTNMTHRGRSCLYSNLYFIDGTLITLGTGPPPGLPVEPPGRRPGRWQPQHRRFGTENDLSDFLVKLAPNLTELPGLHAHFSEPYVHNIGHAIFDGLWAAFVALGKFGLDGEEFAVLGGGGSGPCNATAVPPIDKSKKSPATMGAGTSSGNDPCPWRQFEEFASAFGGRQVLYLSTLPTTAARLERVVVGNGLSNAFTHTADMVLPGAVDGGGFELFRRRTAVGFSLQTSSEPALPSTWAHSKSHRDCRHEKCHINGVVIENKRFSRAERANISAAMNSVAAKTSAKLLWLNWRSLPSISEQLRLVAATDIYITAPGTGMMLHPFMPRGGVLVNLGEELVRYNTSVFSAQEEYIIAASQYQRALYYPSEARRYGLDTAILTQLLTRAVELASTGFPAPIPTNENLSPEGQLFRMYCEANSTACAETLDDINLGADSTVGFYALFSDNY